MYLGCGTQILQNKNNVLYRMHSCVIWLRHTYNIIHPPVTLSPPTVGDWDTSMWTLTSPDGSRVERYIVEFECRVRNITFVEKYMSVSASGGTGRVATSASCFGGLGQLYRVKVWAVSGPNISPALVCTLDGQCREEGGSQTLTTQLITITSTSQTLADNAGIDRLSTSPSIYIFVYCM